MTIFFSLLATTHHEEGVTTTFPVPFSPTGDVLLGAVLVFCMVIGVPGNVLAVAHFVISYRESKQGTNQSVFNLLYSVIGVTDILICATLFPNIQVFFNGRDSPLFQDSTFCVCWGFLWEILPFFSVFLVMVLSISRTKTLYHPLVKFSEGFASLVITLYIFVLSIKIISPILVIHEVMGIEHQHGSFVNSKYGAYCHVYVRESETFWMVSSTVNWILLVMPIFPIIVSCVLTIYKLAISRRASMRTMTPNVVQTRATITVVIFTATYILYNIPIFLNYLLFAITVYNHKQYTDVFNTGTLYWYSWNFTYVVCTALNSTTNPVIYAFRMKKFRRRFNIIGQFFHWRYSTLTTDLRSHDHQEAMNN